MDTPEAPPPVRPAFGRHVVMLGLAVAALLVAAGAARRRLAQDSPAAPKGRPMLLVLPFENVSGDPQQERLSDGLTGETIAELERSQPSRLGVIPMASAMRYRGTAKGTAEIGRELRVDFVLEGSVRQAGERIRITAQLVQARDQAHLWGQSYEGDLRDLSKLQKEVARAVADGIRLQLTPRSDRGLPP